jgi:hypothetical protein
LESEVPAVRTFVASNVASRHSYRLCDLPFYANTRLQQFFGVTELGVHTQAQHMQTIG